jgi:hypothetical protein
MSGRQDLDSPPHDGDGSDDAGKRQGALQDMDLHGLHPDFVRYPARTLCDSTIGIQPSRRRKNEHRVRTRAGPRSRTADPRNVHNRLHGHACLVTVKAKVHIFHPDQKR